ncbi:hypothetical protein BKA60DRAFT_123967 [Fusarium oxysporum]|nr:hypothetical protein BKA60DRAFT_123967 [Fusarium oxysporum]
MCTSKFIKYTCGCKKEMEFIQCQVRQGTNTRCHPIIKEWAKDSSNYCSRHLVKPDAPVKYTDPNGEIVEE